MGRPREFDEDEVLQRALETFWQHGYEATSIRDLMRATGLAKGSLYKAFGDKKQLFRKSLERYLEAGYRTVRATALEADDAVSAVDRWLEQVVAMSTCESGRGCFAVNCTVESAIEDAEVSALLAAHRAQINRLFRDVLAHGVDKGTVRPDLDPTVGAELIATFVYGLQVAGKGGLTRKQARAQADWLVRTLRP